MLARMLTSIVILAVGCSESQSDWITPITESPRAHQRWQALEAAMADGRRDMRPWLERLAVEEPDSDDRLRALELWIAQRYPFKEQLFLFGVMNNDPDVRLRIDAARGFVSLWGESGLERLFHYYLGCASSIWLTNTCYAEMRGLADRPRESMRLLMKTISVGDGDERGAELAMDLSHVLVDAEPGLLQDDEVRAWVEAFRVQGKTVAIRQAAEAVLTPQQDMPLPKLVP